MALFLPLLPLIGGGHTRFQPVYVADLAQAIVRSVSDARTAGRTYQLGGPTVYSFRALLEFILKETGRKRLLVPVRYFFATIKAFFLQLPSFILPIKPLLTMDQVRLLRTDAVVQPGAFTLDDLGIAPESVEAIVPGYLWRFHPKGQFGDRVRAQAPASAG